MKAIKLTAVLCFLGGVANAQPHNHLQGSDTLAFYTRALIDALGLGGQLTYAGGGSATGIRAAITARTDDPSQRVNPASRFVNDQEIQQAMDNDLRFVDYVLGLDAVVIHVNDAGNSALTQMAFSDARNIWQCQSTTWDQVPGSDRTDSIIVLARDELSGTTDNFVSRIGGFIQTPPDTWWNNYPCVDVCRGDGCTQLIGLFTASIGNAIGYTGLPGLRKGNRDLALCNDTNPPRDCMDEDYIFQSVDTIRDTSYPLSRKLHLYHVEGISDSFGPEGPQAALLAGSMNPDVACPILADNDFIPVEGFCPK
jgi:ABC-type phosphate transport system substrate-binding protein